MNQLLSFDLFFGFLDTEELECQLLRYFQLRFFFTHQTNKSGSIIFFTFDDSPGHQPEAHSGSGRKSVGGSNRREPAFTPSGNSVPNDGFIACEPLRRHFSPALWFPLSRCSSSQSFHGSRSPRFGGRGDISGNVPDFTHRLIVTRDNPVIRDISLNPYPLLCSAITSVQR